MLEHGRRCAKPQRVKEVGKPKGSPCPGFETIWVFLNTYIMSTLSSLALGALLHSPAIAQESTKQPEAQAIRTELDNVRAALAVPGPSPYTIENHAPNLKAECALVIDTNNDGENNFDNDLTLIRKDGVSHAYLGTDEIHCDTEMCEVIAEEQMTGKIKKRAKINEINQDIQAICDSMNRFQLDENSDPNLVNEQIQKRALEHWFGISTDSSRVEISRGAALISGYGFNEESTPPYQNFYRSTELPGTVQTITATREADAGNCASLSVTYNEHGQTQGYYLYTSPNRTLLATSAFGKMPHGSSVECKQDSCEVSINGKTQTLEDPQAQDKLRLNARVICAQIHNWE